MIKSRDCWFMLYLPVVILGSLRARVYCARNRLISFVRCPRIPHSLLLYPIFYPFRTIKGSNPHASHADPHRPHDLPAGPLQN